MGTLMPRGSRTEQGEHPRDGKGAPGTTAPEPAGGRSRGPVMGRRLFLGASAGLALAAAGILATDRLLPSEGQADQLRMYDYVYSGPKSENVNFTLANMSADGYLTFGSSEFYISKSLVRQCPQAVFGENVTGVDLTFIGEAYDQCLWQAIAAGAYGARAKNRKVVLIVSPQWFFKGGGDQAKFSSKFSYLLYRDFCANEMLSDAVRSYVRGRVLDLGIDAGKVAAANRDTALDAMNDAVLAAAARARNRMKIPHVIEQAPRRNGFKQKGTWTGEPDWSGLLQQAVSDGTAATTSNDYGIYDAYWEKNKGYAPERGQRFDEADAEYDDLACFVQTCLDSRLEPLLVILPMHGRWYDEQGVGADVRAVFYQRVRDMCASMDVAYADFSSCEYEKYFLCDTVHPGWVGWVRIEQSVYDFLHDWDDTFLGGGDGYGTAEGLSAL